MKNNNYKIINYKINIFKNIKKHKRHINLKLLKNIYNILPSLNNSILIIYSELYF
jgi:hypothetical protein